MVIVGNEIHNSCLLAGDLTFCDGTGTDRSRWGCNSRDTLNDEVLPAINVCDDLLSTVSSVCFVPRSAQLKDNVHKVSDVFSWL